MGSGILGQEERLLRGEMDHFHHKEMDYRIPNLSAEGLLGDKVLQGQKPAGLVGSGVGV